jgi:hypothetical protein
MGEDGGGGRWVEEGWMDLGGWMDTLNLSTTPAKNARCGRSRTGANTDERIAGAPVSRVPCTLNRLHLEGGSRRGRVDGWVCGRMGGGGGEDGWMDFTVHGTEQGACDYDRNTRDIQHLRICPAHMPPS